VSALRSELREQRLVTIVGVATMGKIHLAQQVEDERLPSQKASTQQTR
jgi:predicted ATPase